MTRTLPERNADTVSKEPLPDPTPAELAREAQEEARVFAAQGLIVNLQRMLDRLDPSRGDRIEDNPEVEDLYRRTVEVQPEIVGLMKKYADQKGKLAMRLRQSRS